MGSAVIWFGNAVKALKSQLSIPGSTSGVFTQSAGTAVTDYTITWPAAQGSANTFPKNDGSGNLSWAAGTGTVPTASKSGTYNAATTDYYIACDTTSAGFTINLFASSGNGGSVLIIEKTDTTFNAVTITPNGADTVEGAASTTLNTVGECITLCLVSTTWRIVSRRINGTTTTYTPQTGITNATRDNSFYSRRGDKCYCQLGFTFTGAGSLVGLTQAQLLPNGLTVDTAKIAPYLGGSNNDCMNVGTFDAIDNAVAGYRGALTYDATATTFNLYAPNLQSAIFTPGSADAFSVSFEVPISTWKG